MHICSGRKTDSVSSRPRRHGPLLLVRLHLADLPGGSGTRSCSPVIFALRLTSFHGQNGKTIIFGTKARFGHYFGIEVAWALGGMVALVLVIIFKRRQAVKQAEKRRAEEEKNGKEQ